MRQDGKPVCIADDGSNERSGLTDGEDRSSSMEIWLREGRLHATRAMTGNGFSRPAVADSSDGESDGTNESVERDISESPAESGEWRIGGDGWSDCGERHISGEGRSDCGEQHGAFGGESGARGKPVNVGGGTRLPLNQ